MENLRFTLIIIGLITGFFVNNSVGQTTGAAANHSIDISGAYNSVISEKNNKTLPSVDKSSKADSIENQKINIPDSYKKKLAQNSGASSDGKSRGIGFGGKSLFTSTTIALIFVIILIFAVAWIFRKAWPGGSMLFGVIPFVNILGRTNLSPKQSIVAIKVGERIILLGVTEHHISTIISIDDEKEVSKFLSYIEQNRSSSISSTFRNLFCPKRTKNFQKRLIKSKKMMF